MTLIKGELNTFTHILDTLDMLFNLVVKLFSSWLNWKTSEILLIAGKLCIKECGMRTKDKADTWLSHPRAGGQGPYLRSLYHLGRSSEAKDR